MNSPQKLHWSDLPAVVFFVFLAGVVLLQFSSRYILNDSVAWTEEVARYLLIVVAYFGSLMAIRRSGHIFLEVIYRRTGTANVKALALLADLATVVFNGTLAILALQLALAADQRMISIDLPKSLVYGAVAVALSASTLVALRGLVRRAGRDPESIRLEIESAATGDEAV